MSDVSDALLMKNNDSFLEGNGIIILILFFLIFGFGGTGLGGRTATASTDSNLQTAELYSALGSQDIKNDIRSGFQDTISGQFAVSKEVLQNRYDTAMAIANANQTNALAFAGLTQELMQNRYDNQLAISNVNQNIANLGFQMQQCCCDMKTQMLQDKYDAAQNQLNLAEIASANAVQTQNLLNSMGRYVMNPAVSPYSSCGCSGS